MSHFRQRLDAVWHSGRRYVPTIWGQAQNNTRWVANWREFVDAGGVAHFNEDQTEIVLTLPAGCKFSIQFERPKN